MSTRGRRRLVWIAGIGSSCLGLLLGCGSTGTTPSAVGGAAGVASAGAGAANAGAGAQTSAGGTIAGSINAAGQPTAGASAGQAGAASPDFVCNPDSVTVVGELDGAPLNIVHDTRTFAIGPGGVRVDFGEMDYGSGAFVAGIWQFGTFLNEVADGAQSPLGKVRLQFEAPDPRAGVELCADGAATGRRSKSESKMTYDLTRLVPLVCPGTPVDGSVTVDTRVHGMVDGHALDAAVTSNFEGKGTQWIDSTQVVLPLTTDDATGMAPSGKITGGRLELRDEGNAIGDIYCVGQADFQRPSPDAFNVTLSGLSKIGNCRTSPSVGHFAVCAQGDPL